MRNALIVSVTLLMALTACGLSVIFVGKARDAATLSECKNNLKGIGLALNNYRQIYKHFPTGTLPNPTLPPEKRLSWTVQVWPYYLTGGVAPLLDKAKAWDAADNCPPRCRVCVDKVKAEYREEPVGDLADFTCPANSARPVPQMPSPTSYLGVAGLGEAAAQLPLSDRRAGLFGFDRKVGLPDLQDGEATTMVAIEALDGGPWTAGGRATVRGLLLGGRSYMGEKGQFGSGHRGGSNAVFADASVHFLSESMSPRVFEAMATIAGGEKVPAFEEE